MNLHITFLSLSLLQLTTMNETKGLVYDDSYSSEV